MGSCQTIWETGTKVDLVITDSEAPLEDVVEQIQATLLGCGYTSEALKNYFK